MQGRKWTTFCAKLETDHSKPAVGDVLDFLSDLFDAGLTHSAINTAQSALASFITLERWDNALIYTLLIEIFQARPPKPKYDAVWNVYVVLNYVKTLLPVESLKLRLST
jgi:hypothetical protein